MNKLKTSLLILMLLASISISAGYAPDSVQIALKKIYPTAVGIAWSQDKEYYVADFMMNGFDTKVWFNSDAEWVMKQTDWETCIRDSVGRSARRRVQCLCCQSVFGRGGAERYLGAVSQMAIHRGHTSGQTECADKISAVVYSSGRNAPSAEYHL